MHCCPYLAKILNPAFTKNYYCTASHKYMAEAVVNYLCRTEKCDYKNCPAFCEPAPLPNIKQ